MLSIRPRLLVIFALMIVEEPTATVGTVEGRVSEKLGAITVTWKLMAWIDVRFDMPLIAVTVTI